MSSSAEGASDAVDVAALLRERAGELRSVVVPGGHGFRLLAPKGVAATALRPPPPKGHGSTRVVARIEDPGGLSVAVQRSSLENDVDAASWLELSLGAPSDDYGPVKRSILGGLPTGEALSTEGRGERRAVVRSLQRGRNLWTLEASLPHARWRDDRALAHLAVESFQPAGPAGLAESLDGLRVRGLGAQLRWPTSWFFSSELDVPGGVAGVLERNLRGTSVGLMQVLLGSVEEETGMTASATEWLESAGIANAGRGAIQGEISRRVLGEAVLVLALAGPSRLEDPSLWITNRRARDIVLERSSPSIVP